MLIVIDTERTRNIGISDHGETEDPGNRIIQKPDVGHLGIGSNAIVSIICDKVQWDTLIAFLENIPLLAYLIFYVLSLNTN
ncbi:MAG: hypothetical protein ACTSRI_00305 [Promethearchaeota archaeon]